MFFFHAAGPGCARPLRQSCGARGAQGPILEPEIPGRGFHASQNAPKVDRRSSGRVSGACVRGGFCVVRNSYSQSQTERSTGNDHVLLCDGGQGRKSRGLLRSTANASLRSFDLPASRPQALLAVQSLAHPTDLWNDSGDARTPGVRSLRRLRGIGEWQSSGRRGEGCNRASAVLAHRAHGKEMIIRRDALQCRFAGARYEL